MQARMNSRRPYQSQHIALKYVSTLQLQGINTILLAYCVPGALIKQMVMVNVSEDHCCTILERQSRITEKYLSFAYDANNLRDVPSLGKDFSPAYGYGQEHKTLCS
jgi:hypothetical protein